MRRRNAFTLVELLVVIGIIAVLISVLLPTLGAARRAANTLACLSNVRQLGVAAMLFAQEHGGYLPVASDDMWAKMNDPLRRKWSYRDSPSGPVVYDHFSSLLPYLGVKGVQTFMDAPMEKSKVFRCPSDPWMDAAQPGYRIFQNVAPVAGNPYFPVSYGYNADIASVSDTTGIGRFGKDPSHLIKVVFGPITNSVYNGTKFGAPLQCKLGKISKPAEVLLFADCGVRPQVGNTLQPLDYSDCLYYTSHGMLTTLLLKPEDMGRLSGVVKTPDWLGNRVPVRHGGKVKNRMVENGKINIAFADGHADTVLQGDFNKVRVTPYQPR